MGGTFWQYFVPYQHDIQQAFVALREQLFADGDYPVMPPPAAGMTFEQFCAYYGGVLADRLSEAERREEEELFHQSRCSNHYIRSASLALPSAGAAGNAV